MTQRDDTVPAGADPAGDHGPAAAPGRPGRPLAPHGPWRILWRRAARLRRPLRSWKLRIGLGIVFGFVLAGAVGSVFAGSADAISTDTLLPPSGRHPLGTTQAGQDVLAQLLVATRGSLEIGALVAVIATTLSISVGVVGGYVGGRIDEALSLLSNVFLVIPSLPLVILVTDYFEDRGPVTVAAVISISSWAASARVLRAQTMSIRERDYVLSARATGERWWRVVFVEILPNLLPIVASQFVFAIVFAVLAEAGLSFLGLGSLNHLTWGSMLYFAQNAQALTLGAWWWFVPPGLSIALLGCGLSLVNFGIDEMVDPRLRAALPHRRRHGPRVDHVR